MDAYKKCVSQFIGGDAEPHDGRSLHEVATCADLNFDRNKERDRKERVRISAAFFERQSKTKATASSRQAPVAKAKRLPVTFCDCPIPHKRVVNNAKPPTGKAGQLALPQSREASTGESVSSSRTAAGLSDTTKSQGLKGNTARPVGRQRGSRAVKVIEAASDESLEDDDNLDEVPSTLETPDPPVCNRCKGLKVPRSRREAYRKRLGKVEQILDVGNANQDDEELLQSKSPKEEHGLLVSLKVAVRSDLDRGAEQQATASADHVQRCSQLAESASLGLEANKDLKTICDMITAVPVTAVNGEYSYSDTAQAQESVPSSDVRTSGQQEAVRNDHGLNKATRQVPQPIQRIDVDLTFLDDEHEDALEITHETSGRRESGNGHAPGLFEDEQAVEYELERLDIRKRKLEVDEQMVDARERLGALKRQRRTAQRFKEESVVKLEI